MSFIDSIVKPFADSFTNQILASVREVTAYTKATIAARSYRLGHQPDQLKVDREKGQYNDNLKINKIRKYTNTTVSQMLFGGVEFRVKGDETGESDAKKYLDQLWDANHKEQLFQRAVLYGIENGTSYLQLCDPKMSQGAVADQAGKMYPRLILIDPLYMKIDVLPEDWEVIIRYTHQYTYMDEKDKDHGRKVVYEHVNPDPEAEQVEKWTITTFDEIGGRWVVIDKEDWPYPFAPIIHWQALPALKGPYGEADLPEDILDLQDKINAAESMTFKAERLGVFPFRWGKGLLNIQTLTTGPDKIVSVGPEGEIFQFPPDLQLLDALSYCQHLNAEFCSVTRMVDPDTFKDKVGQITNFGLRVLYQDNKAKIDTKRELMSDALEEINRRLLIMAGKEAVETEVVWQDFVPQNKQEDATYHQTITNMGVESKQTAAETIGLDWEKESDRKSEEQKNDDVLASSLVKDFVQGKGRTTMAAIAPKGKAAK